MHVHGRNIFLLWNVIFYVSGTFYEVPEGDLNLGDEMEGRSNFDTR